MAAWYCARKYIITIITSFHYLFTLSHIWYFGSTKLSSDLWFNIWLRFAILPQALAKRKVPRPRSILSCELPAPVPARILPSVEPLLLVLLLDVTSHNASTRCVYDVYSQKQKFEDVLIQKSHRFESPRSQTETCAHASAVDQIPTADLLRQDADVDS